MIPLTEAQARILAAVAPLRPSAMPLDDALGCVTSVPLTATESVPPFANTAMDGFAVRAGDTSPGARLRVVGTLAAGVDPAGMRVGEGEAIRIMTGAPIPEGADAVVMVELTSTDGDAVVVAEAVPVGNHIRAAGEDLSPGQEVFPAFTVLAPGHVGVLASLGFRKVPVFPRARVGVLSTGDEVIDGAGELKPGQIRDSNRHTLLGLLREAGCEPVDLGIVRDDETAVRKAIEEGLAAVDALVTTGGVSMGDFDEVKKVLTDLAGELAWMQVAIKPAKPLAFGMVGAKPVFGLPGNPASSMVSFELFARPALRRMMGHPAPVRATVRAVADEGLARRPDGKLHLVRVAASFGADDGRLHVRSSGGQGSNLLRSMALANALALVPDGEGVPAGGEVDVLVLAYP